MGSETVGGEETSPEQQSPDTPSKPTNNGGPHGYDDETMPRWRIRLRHISPCMSYSLVSVLLLAILVSSLSPNPLYALMFAFLAILPAGIVARFLMTNFHDTAVSEPFLVKQFFIGAIPLAILVLIVELIFTGIISLALFSSELATVSDELLNGANSTLPLNTTTPTDTTRTQTTLKLQSILLAINKRSFLDVMLEVVPLWKAVLYSFLTAFLVAALVEEVGKWLVSGRYKKINSEPSNLELGRTISCRGILAICSMGALGFATIENLGFVLFLSASRSDGFPFNLVFMAVLRGILAFPVHVGAQFFVGVTAAQNYIFHDNRSVFYAILIVIMFHGSFDAAALVVSDLLTMRSWPQWSMAFVIGFQLFLAGLLLILCRGRSKALLERERIAVPLEEEV